MCASCGCNHVNYNHEMPTMPGSYKGIDKVNYNMPKVPAVPAIPKSTKKGGPGHNDAPPPYGETHRDRFG